MGLALLQQCVSCGVQVPVFKGDELFVCHACNTCQQWDETTMRFTALGKMPALPRLLNRIHIGDKLSYEGDLFVVSGCIYQKYKEGSCIFWAAHSANGIIWIEEESGGLMVFHPVNELLTIEQKKRLVVGKAFTVYPNKEMFTVTGIMDVTEQYVSGSIPHADIVQHRISIWMQNDVGAVYRMALNKQLQGVAYIGKTLNEESRAQFLNKTPSAQKAAAPVVVHSCPVCRKDVPSFTAQQNSHIICSSCFSLLAGSPHGVSVIKNRGNAFKTNTTLKIGDKGILENVNWTVIAIHEKNEAGTHYYWREYTLFHPEYPYHFLSEFDGHWNFLRPVEGMPVREDRNVVYGGKTYAFFLKGRAITRVAAGELAGIPDFTTRTDSQEYIAPPFLLTNELNYSTFGWYQGQYVHRKTLAEAFGKTISDMPATIGVGSSQPAPEWIIPQKWVFTSFLVPMLILFILQFMAGNKNTVVYSERYTLPDSLTTTYTAVTPIFSLNDGRKNLEISLTSDVQNNWSEASVVLINQSTLMEYATSVGTEYYTGWDGGERWQEGAQINQTLLTAIPEGRYRAEIALASGTSNATGRNIQLLFTRDVPTTSNFWWSVLAISILPLSLLLRRHFFEKRRWTNSDYSE